MAATRYVALLRGINVGGRNLVGMADLRRCFEEQGYDEVSTYIQSGNVLFETEGPSRSLESDVETMLERHLGVPIRVMLRSHRQLNSVVARAPDSFGATPDRYHSDVIFLKDGLSPRKAMDLVELRDEVDQAWTGPRVLYFARLSARRTQSKMSRIVGTPEYQLMTIRSWSTVTKLLGQLDARTA
ncbi:MAG: DUF1697 domain-containing protein [Acidimicrobiales bacterium]